MPTYMSDHRQIERIVQIIQRLALDREITVAGLHKYFSGNVTKRTLERDLEALSSAGIPLLNKKGKGRELVWYLEDKFRHFIPQTIGIKELQAAMILQKLTDLLKGTPLATDAKSLLDKAKQLYDPRILVDADQLDSPLFGISQTGYIDYGPHACVINDLIRAASDRFFCDVVYQGYQHEKPNRYMIAPYMMVLRKGALYLVAFEEGKQHFIYLLVHRIKSLKIKGERFKRRKDFRFEYLVKNSIGIFSETGQKPVNVVLKFQPIIGDIIADRIWHPSQKIKRHKDGSVTLSMKVVISDELRGWIGSWLDYVEVVEPKELNDQFKERILSCK